MQKYPSSVRSNYGGVTKVVVNLPNNEATRFAPNPSSRVASLPGGLIGQDNFRGTYYQSNRKVSLPGSRRLPPTPSCRSQTASLAIGPSRPYNSRSSTYRPSEKTFVPIPSYRGQSVYYQAAPMKTVIPPDSGWSWVILVASLLASIIIDGVIFSFGVITPEFVKQFGVSRSTVGWMGSLLISITLLVGPLASILCEKLNFRTVSVTGSIIAAVGFALPYLYPELWFLFLTSLVLSGIGFGLVYLPSVVIINVWFEEKRSLALGIATCGSGLGTIIFSPLFNFLIVSFGWQLTMLITGSVLLLLVPVCMTFKNRETGGENEKEEVQKNPKGQSKDEEMSFDDYALDYAPSGIATKASFTELLKNRVVWLFLVSNLLTCIGFNTPYLFTKDRAFIAGFSQTKASNLISAIGFGNCIGKLLFGFLGTFKFVNRIHLYNMTLVVSGLVLVISIYVRNYILMVLYNVVYGIMTGPFTALFSVACVDMFGINNLERTLGIALVAQGLGSLVGPPLSGLIFDLTNSYSITFAVCGISITVSGLMMYLAGLSRQFRKIMFF